MLNFDVLPARQQMVKSDQFVVEAHFVPLPANEAEERKRRFRALLLRGALRFVQQPTDRSNKPGKPEAPKPLLVESVQK
jgi:hypothetical protein